jgi:hypothetical protein
MQSKEIRYTTAGLLIEFTGILIDLFPGVSTMADFIVAFNDMNFTYQRYNRRRLDSHFIRDEKEISCQSTAMLMGLHLKLNNVGESEKDEPVFFIQQSGLNETQGYIDNQKAKSPSQAHVILKPMRSSDNENSFFDMWSEPGDPICYVRPVPEGQKFGKVHVIHHTGTFFAHNVSVLGLNGEARQRLAAHQNQIGRYVGKYENCIEDLREAYAQGKKNMRGAIWSV